MSDRVFLTDFDQIYADVLEHIPLKEKTGIGDTVIIIGETPNKGAFYNYGNILGFDSDTSKRDEWWFVKICVLFPFPNIIVWTLRTSQIEGEIFTMGGLKRFIKSIDFEKIKTLEQLNVLKGQTQNDKSVSEPKEDGKIVKFDSIKRSK